MLLLLGVGDGVTVRVRDRVTVEVVGLGTTTVRVAVGVRTGPLGLVTGLVRALVRPGVVPRAPGVRRFDDDGRGSDDVGVLVGRVFGSPGAVYFGQFGYSDSRSL